MSTILLFHVGYNKEIVFKKKLINYIKYMYYYLVTCDGFYFDLIKSNKFLNDDNINSYMEEKLNLKNKQHLKYYIRNYWSESGILKY